MNLQNSLWTEKYRPQQLDEYVGSDDVKIKIKNWLQQGDIPSLLFYGPAGTGKTTLAKIIAKQLDSDVLYINASDENSIDTLRDKIKGFAATAGFSKWKIVILDESDFMTQNFQAALRNVIETYSRTTRFILTCNFVEKILDPIQSRLVPFQIIPPDKKTVAKRAIEVLKMEGIEFDIKDVIAVVEQNYPDQRKIINSLQRNSISGKFSISDEIKLIAGYCEKVLQELKQQNQSPEITFKNIRQIIADSKVRQFDDLFKYLFENLDEFAPKGKKAAIILTLADYQFKSAQVLDKEIPVAAMILTILNEIKG